MSAQGVESRICPACKRGLHVVCIQHTVTKARRDSAFVRAVVTRPMCECGCQPEQESERKERGNG